MKNAIYNVEVEVETGWFYKFNLTTRPNGAEIEKFASWEISGPSGESIGESRKVPAGKLDEEIEEFARNRAINALSVLAASYSSLATSLGAFTV